MLKICPLKFMKGGCVSGLQVFSLIMATSWIAEKSAHGNSVIPPWES